MKNVSLKTVSIVIITCLNLSVFSQAGQVVNRNQGVRVSGDRIGNSTLTSNRGNEQARILIQSLKDAGKTLAEALCEMRNNAVITAANVLTNSATIYGVAEATVIIRMKTCWTAEEIAAGLLAAYGYTTAQIASKLRAAGYSANAVRLAIQTGLNQTFDAAIGSLNQCGLYGSRNCCGG